MSSIADVKTLLHFFDGCHMCCGSNNKRLFYMHIVQGWKDCECFRYDISSVQLSDLIKLTLQALSLWPFLMQSTLFVAVIVNLVGTEDGDVQCCKRCKAYRSNLSTDMTSYSDSTDPANYTLLKRIYDIIVYNNKKEPVKAKLHI